MLLSSILSDNGNPEQEVTDGVMLYNLFRRDSLNGIDGDRLSEPRTY